MADAETNWIDFFVSLSPVVQTAIWAGVVVAGFVVLRDPIKQFAKTIVNRVSSGDNFITPWLSLERRAKLEKLEKADFTKTEVDNIEAINQKESLKNAEVEVIYQPESKIQWSLYRQNIYQSQKGLFLVHVISPSATDGQKYDIYILVKRHKDRPIDDIEKVDFYLGQYWGNKIFTELPRDGLVGLRTAAYGPFLCVCKVHLKSQEGTALEPIMLQRYIDFEMGQQ